MDLETELQRGELARQVIENPVYQETMTSVRNAIITAWENAPIRDKEGQNELKLMLRLLNDVKKNVETVMETGKLAKLQIEQESWIEKAKNRFK